MARHIIDMKLVKTTTRMYRYDAVAEDAVVRDVYVLKSAFGDTPPETIKVTLTS